MTYPFFIYSKEGNMRKIIKRKIHISTHKRDLIDFINDEFYSHDTHNAFIEFTMKSLPTDNIIALFYFQKTKRYIETKAFVDGDKFTIEFDTSLITADETVLGFIYFEKVAQSADVHRFSFGVRVSEIDKLHDIPIQEQTTKRVVAIEDIVTKSELDELFKRIEKNGGTYNDTEIRSSISSIEERMHNLESKPDKDTVYDDSDVKSRLSTLETNASRYLTEHQSLSEYALKSEIPQAYNDSALADRVTRLEQKPAVDTSGLATKEELQEVRNAQPQIDKSDLVTKEELEAKGYLTAHQNLDEYAKKSEIPERYNDASLVERVTSLESKAIANGSYDDKPLLEKIHAIEERFNNSSNLYLTAHQSLDHLVTKQELDSKGYLTSHQDISGLVTKEELASKNYLTEHQSLASLVTKDELEQKGYLTNHQDLSEYAKKTELYNDTALKERVSVLENKTPVDLSNLVTHEELESKHYLTEHQDISNLVTKQELHEATEIDYSQIVTHEELENKHYLTEHQSLANYALKSEIPQSYNDTDLKERVTSLEAKALANGAYDDSNLRTRIHALETKEDKDTVYDDAEVKRRLSALESKPDVQVDSLVTKQELESKGYLTNHQDISNLATNSKVEAVESRVGVLENKGFLTAHQDLSEYAKKTELPTPYNDTALTERVAKLETKEDKDTVYNDAELRSRVLALESKTDNDTVYNDSELRGRVSALENKTDKDTIYNDEEIKRRLTTLEAKPTVDTTDFAKKTEVPTVDSVNNLLRTQGEQATKISALENKSAYEIHGTGMPNGKVSAPIGTTYVDMNVTNGALKWIKRTGTGNTGWQVFTGDTGWRTLPLINKRGSARLQVRRINDQVIVKFDGLSWGWFGVDDVSKQEQQANISDKTIGGKKYTWIRLNVGRGNFVLPEGFRSASSLLSGLYGDLGDLLGSVYVGGTADSDALQLRYAMERKALTSNILSQIRISPITFITDDNWPTTLP